MKNKLVISFSGGRTSAYMTKLLLDKYQNVYEMIVVFANTGKEREETLEFVKKCDELFLFNTIWVEAIIDPVRGKGTRAKPVNFNTASRNGEPFEAMISKHGIPTVRSPHCTRELKKYTINSYVKSLGWKKYQTAIGIRVDEIDRVKMDKKYIYPLVSYQHGVRKNDIAKFWGEQSFDLQLKGYEGNCDLCYKKSFRKLMTLVTEVPQKTEWWQAMEDKYSSFIPEGKKHNKKLIPPFHFFRSNKSMKDIINMANNKFEPAKDDSKYIPEYKQTNLWGIGLDLSNGCSEGCEIF